MNRKLQVGAFEGIAGRVLAGAFSLQALVTGAVVVGFMKGVELGFGRFGQSDLLIYIAIPFVSLLLVRFALNGKAGEPRGFLISSQGGDMGQVVPITLRFLALWALWLVPLELLGVTPERLTQSMMTLAMGQGGGELIGLTVTVVLCMAACPPIFLIMSVGSPGFLDTFLPVRWGAMFRGRLSQLRLIYVLYLGAVGVISMIGVPLMIALSTVNPMGGQILGWVVTVFVSGAAIDLLGRLCGFFVLAGGSDWDRAVAPVTLSGAAESAQLAPIVLSSVAAATPGGTKPAVKVYKPPLDNPREHLEVIVADFNKNPERTLSELEGLREEYAPHPLVLHSLCILYDRADRREDSCQVAPEALSVCLQSEANHLAADILITRFDQVHEFGLDWNTLLTLAETLQEQGNPAQAEVVYRMLLRQARGDRSAVKGLLKVAESCLGRDGDPQRAKGIYMFLLQNAGDSPLAEFMRDGLAEAERKLAA